MEDPVILTYGDSEDGRINIIKNTIPYFHQQVENLKKRRTVAKGMSAEQVLRCAVAKFADDGFYKSALNSNGPYATI
jgi:hypothetical protein